MQKQYKQTNRNLSGNSRNVRAFHCRRLMRTTSVVGPGGGGAMYHATVNPRDPNEVLVACDMTGSYISHDGGHSWRMFNLRGTVRFFAFDPVQPRTIYAGTQALWRSTDDGVSLEDGLACPVDSARCSDGFRSRRRDHRFRRRSGGRDRRTGHRPVGFAHAVLLQASRTRSRRFFYPAMPARRGRRIHDLPEHRERCGLTQTPTRRPGPLYRLEDGESRSGSRASGQDRPAPKDVIFTDISAGFSQAQGIMLYATAESGIFLSWDGGASWIASPLPGTERKFALSRRVCTILNRPMSPTAIFSSTGVHGWAWRERGTVGIPGHWCGRKQDVLRQTFTMPGFRSRLAWSGKIRWKSGVADQDPELCYRHGLRPHHDHDRWRSDLDRRLFQKR